jgi:antitoxin CptB
MNTAAEDFHRTYWHSRRGMLELDLILMPFVEKHYRLLSDSDKQRYLRLLECEDQDLFSWFMHHKQPEDAELAQTVAMVMQKHFTPP